MKHIGHFLIVLFALFYISSCTNTSVHQAEVTLPFLDLSSDVASINDPQEIPVLKEALKIEMLDFQLRRSEYIPKAL